MRKKFFSLAPIFVLSLAFGATVLATNIPKMEKPISSSETEDSIVTQKDDDRLFQQCFAELMWQSSQMNLFYCPDFEFPVIRTVASNNWNLIEDASIFNVSSKEDLDTAELLPCAPGITEFFYLPADETTSEKENPPESGWLPILPNKNGNYRLPLKEGEEINGCYYVVFKYVIGDSEDCNTFYGMICLSTIF